MNRTVQHSEENSSKFFSPCMKRQKTNRFNNESNNTLPLLVNNNDMVNKLGGAVLENNVLIQNVVKFGNKNTYGSEQNYEIPQIANQVIHEVGETQNGLIVKKNYFYKKNTTQNDSMINPVLLDQSSSYTTGTENVLTNNVVAQTALLGE